MPLRRARQGAEEEEEENDDLLRPYYFLMQEVVWHSVTITSNVVGSTTTPADVRKKETMTRWRYLI